MDSSREDVLLLLMDLELQDLEDVNLLGKTPEMNMIRPFCCSINCNQCLEFHGFGLA